MNPGGKVKGKLYSPRSLCNCQKHRELKSIQDAPSRAWWVSEQRPKCSVQVIFSYHSFMVKNEAVQWKKKIASKYSLEKSKETTRDFWFPVPVLACSVYVLERNFIPIHALLNVFMFGIDLLHSAVDNTAIAENKSVPLGPRSGH